MVREDDWRVELCLCVGRGLRWLCLCAGGVHAFAIIVVGHLDSTCGFNAFPATGHIYFLHFSAAAHV
jgi:hypothetical protein